MAQRVKLLPAMRETQVPSPGQEDPFKMEMAPTPVLLPGKFHGWQNLVGYSPRDHKVYMTEQLHYPLPRKGLGGAVAMSRKARCSFGILVSIKKQAEKRYALLEKKLSAVYGTLLSTEVIMEKTLVLVKTAHLIVGWLWSWVSAPKTGVGQIPT